MKKGGNLWKTLAGTAVGLVFLYLAARKVDPVQVRKAFATVSLPWVLVTAILAVVSMWIRSKRWQVMLAHKKKTEVYGLFKIVMMGFAANNLLPARLGEFIRAWLLGKKEGVGASFALATIVLERIIDTVAILAVMSVFYAGLLAGGVSLPGGFDRGGPFMVLLLAGGTGVLLFLRFRGAWIRSLAGRFGGRFGLKIRGILVSFTEGLDLIRSRRDAAVIGMYSVVLWLTVFVGFDTALRSMRFADVPFYASAVIAFLVLVGIMIPSAPAYVGTIQFMCVQALEPFGVPESAAFTYSLVYHFCSFVPVTLIGLFFYWKEHVSFKDVAVGRTESQ